MTRHIGEFPVKRIVKHVGSGNRRKYVIQKYAYGPEVDIVELALHVPQNYIAGKLSIQNQETQKQQNCSQQLLQ